MRTLTVASFLAFVGLALVCIDLLGPFLGLLLWLIAYGIFRAICRWLLRRTDPDRLFTPR